MDKKIGFFHLVESFWYLKRSSQGRLFLNDQLNFFKKQEKDVKYDWKFFLFSIN